MKKTSPSQKGKGASAQSSANSKARSARKGSTEVFGVEAKGKVRQGTDLRSVRVHSIADLPPGFYVHTDREKFWRWIPILDRYILSEIVPPFFVSLLFFTTVYMALALQKMIGLFVGKGVDPLRLLDYFGYLLGNIMPMTIPMACLMSGVMAAGRLSGDSEITAIRSAGISFSRIYIVFLIFGTVMALVVGYLNFYLSPENTRKMEEFNKWVMAYNPLLAMTPGQFSGDKTQGLFEEKGRTMYTEGVNPETGELSGVQIREWTISLEGDEYFYIGTTAIPMGGSRLSQIIAAKKGTLVEKMGPNGEFEKSIRLKGGWILEWNQDKKGFSVYDLRNGEMDYNIPKKEEKKTLELNVSPETFTMPVLISIRNSIESEGLENIPGLEILHEMGLSIKGIGGLKAMVTQLQIDVIQTAQDPTISASEKTQKFSILTQLDALLKQSKKVLAKFNVEIHRRIAMPISCLIFSIISLPLGLVVKRSGKGMSFTMAVVLIIIYWGLFTVGSNVSDNSKFPVWLGPWAGNIVVTIISLNIMLKRTDMRLPLPVMKFFARIGERLSPVSDFLTRTFGYLEPLKTKLTVVLKKLSLWRNREGRG
ncbi:permease, YjgP/YjgQ family [Leptospira inadai serovar Lyme str. 10]|uniref:Permease, YjgP/YjgQ family n=2 Tax=Leptospira inadai serovar Lyme TaxID=293084 RepID=V6HE67_9LEPT|nr:LptF/LptG family permease [Leptospira inadai]EQA38297.1 permease, YjgP/YjgQ family [Leptospira inadai serovar Lyme str. 10]PNV74448.1 YjgP/YjgQ family permease [Leptospira inadai serovar Lyme]